MFIWLMARSKGLIIAKRLILAGQVTTLSELLDIVDKTPLAKGMHTSPVRFNKLISNPGLFTFDDAYAMAQLIGVDERSIIDIIHAQYLQDKKSKKKR